MISNTSLTITWTAAEQISYRVRIYADDSGSLGTILQDTGQVNSTVRSHSLQLDQTTPIWISVQTWNNDGLASDEQTQQHTVDLIPPTAATIAVAGVPADGLIRVTITWPQPTDPGPTPDSADIWRREGTDTTTEIRVAAAVPEAQLLGMIICARRMWTISIRLSPKRDL